MRVAFPNTSVSNEMLLSLPFEDVSDSNHSETWAGCMVSLTNPTR
jgi:uncharacterized metal-binding protein YceD (DUF177 family)